MNIQVSDVVIIKDNKLLLVQELKEIAYGLWDFPGGKIEEGETALEAAKREIKEELNAELKNIRFFKTYVHEASYGTFDQNTFVGEIDEKVSIKEDELLSYGWFDLKGIESMADKLRGKIIIQQARDILNQT